MEAQAIVIMTTVSAEADAEAIGEHLLEADLAACIQEVPITSRYRWQGEVQREGEILLLVKTSSGAADAAMAAIAEHHPYDVPEILAVPATGGSPAYLRWLAVEASGGRSGG